MFTKIIATLLICLACAVQHQAQAAGRNLRDLTILQAEAADVGQDSPATTLKIAGSFDRASRIYAIGETVRVFATANEDAYLTVFAIGPSGNIIQLFPNKLQNDNFAKAGQSVEVVTGRAKIVVSAPAGREVIRVFATNKPVRLTKDGELAPAGDFALLKGGAPQLSRDLALAAQEPDVKIVSDTRVICTVVRLADAPQECVEKEFVALPAPIVVAATAPATTKAEPVQPLRVDASRNPFALVIGSDRPSYQVGDVVTLTATALQACFLSIFEINTLGDARLIFPNQSAQDNMLKEKQTVLVSSTGAPAILSQRGPAGFDQFVAVCSEEAAPIVPGGYVFDAMFTSIYPLSALATAVEAAAIRPGHGAAVSSLVVSVHE